MPDAPTDLLPPKTIAKRRREVEIYPQTADEVTWNYVLVFR